MEILGMSRIRVSISVILSSILLAPVLSGASGYTFVAIPANNCIQTGLISTFPEGMFLAANQLATPFNIATVPATCGITGTGAVISTIHSERMAAASTLPSMWRSRT
jgi:hypothetical protein